MIITAELPTAIMTALREQDIFTDIRFTEEFPYEYKESPLKKITVSVGVGEITVMDASIGNIVANNGGTPVYGMQTECEILLGIYVPFSMDGKRCFEIFTKLLDALLFNADFDIVKADCGRVRANRETAAKVLEARFVMKAFYRPVESEGDGE